MVRAGLRGCTRGLSLQGFLVHAADILCAQIEDLGLSGNPLWVLVYTSLRLPITSSNDAAHRVHQILKDTRFVHIFGMLGVSRSIKKYKMELLPVIT